jgi:hypothetical protein
MKSSLFPDFTQLRLVVCYGRCGIIYLSHLQGTVWTLKRGPIDCHVTSVKNYHFQQRKIPEECRSQRLCSVKSGSEPTLKSYFVFKGITKGRLKTFCLYLLNNAVYVSRNVASYNLMMADDRMENLRTESFVFRFKIPLGSVSLCVCVGGGGRNSQSVYWRATGWKVRGSNPVQWVLDLSRG